MKTRILSLVLSMALLLSALTPAALASDAATVDSGSEIAESVAETPEEAALPAEEPAEAVESPGEETPEYTAAEEAPALAASVLVATVSVGGAVTDYRSSDTVSEGQALVNAWNAAQGKTAEITVVKSVTLDSGYLNMTDAASNVTLKMASNVEIVSPAGNLQPVRVAAGKLTISGGSIKNTAVSDNTSYNFYGIHIIQNGSVTLTDGVSVSTTQGYGVFLNSANASLKVERASVAGSSSGIYVNSGALDVTDATVSGSEYGVWAGGNTTLTIAGGTFTGKTGLYANGASVKLSGGQFSGLTNQDRGVGELLEGGYVYQENGSWVSDTTVSSLTGQVTVRSAPVSVSAPKSIVVKRGNPAVLSVTVTTADASIPVAYQWYQVTAEGDVALPGETNSTLRITDFPMFEQGVDSGDFVYYCRVACMGLQLDSERATVTVGDEFVAYVTMAGKITGYSDILAAFKAVDKQTATLTLLESASANNVTISGGDITLECGDNTISGNGSSSSNPYVINLSGGTLTLKSGTIRNRGTYMRSCAVYVRAGAVLNVDGGVIENTGDQNNRFAVSTTGRATVNIHGGEVRATGDSGVGIYIASGSTVNMDGGSVYGANKGIDSHQSGKAVLTGGTLNGGSTAITVVKPLTVGSFLAPGYAYKGAKGWIYNANVTAIAGPVEVQPTPMEITEMPRTDFMLLKDYATGPTLTVKANARDPQGQLHYQWYLNDVAIDGANGPSFTVPTGLPKQRYVYHCTVSCEGYSLSTNPSIVIVADEAFVCEVPVVTAVYGQKLQELELVNPDGNSEGTWVWDRPQDLVGDAGTQTHSASFYPVESYIYDPMLHVSITVTVEKSSPQLKFVDAYNLDKAYNGKAIPTPIRAHVTITGGKTDGTLSFTWYRDEVRESNKLSGSTGPKDVGDYIVVAELSGTANAAKSTDQIAVHITPKEVQANIQMSKNMPYTGSPIIPVIVVKDGDEVINSSEYTLSITDNVEVGTAKVTVTDNPGGNYIVNGESYFNITPRTVTVSTATAKGKTYDGTPQVEITAVNLSQVSPGDDVRIDVTDLVGEVYVPQDHGHPNVGPYSWVVLHDLKLTGADAENYTLVQPSSSVLLSNPVRIEQAELPQMELETTLHVSTRYDYTYRWFLDDLRPVVSEPMQFINAEYRLGEVTLSEDFYNKDGMRVNYRNNFLEVPITLSNAVKGTENATFEVGTVKLSLRSSNFKEITCTVHLVAGNWISAQIVHVGSAGTEPYDGTAHIGYVNELGGALSKENIQPTNENDPEPSQSVPFRVKYSGIEGTSHNSATTRPIQAGKYRVTLEIAEGEAGCIYIGTDSYEFEITQVAPSYISEPTPKTTLQYNGQSQYLLNAGQTNTGTIVYSLEEDGDFLQYIPTAIDAGDYTVYYKIQGDRNHTDSAVKSVKVTIDKSPVLFNEPQVKEEIIYNGSQQLLITYPPRATGGHIEYSMDGVNYSEEPPMAKDAGNYTFYYKGVGDDNHNDTDVVMLQATITKRSVRVFTAEAEDRPYDGTDEVNMLSVVALKTVDGDDVQVDCEGLKGQIVLEDGAHPVAGEYGWVKLPFLKLTGVESENYVLTQPESLVQLYTDVEITKAPLEPIQITKEIKVKHAATYTWSLLEPSQIPEELKAFNEPTFTLTEIAINSDFYKAETAEIRGSDLVLPIMSAEKPLGDDEPIGHVVVTVSYSNYVDMEYRFDLQAVDKPTVEITGVKSVTTAPYSGSGVKGYTGTPSSNEFKGTYDVYYEGTDGTQYQRSKTPPVAVGTYQVTISIPENDPSYAGSVTLKFEIVKAKPTIKAPVAKTGLVENGNAQALVTAGAATGGRMEYSLEENGDYTEAVPTAVDKGSYTVWYRVVGDANHEDIAPKSLTVVIREKTTTPPVVEPNVTVRPNQDGTVKVSPAGVVPAGTTVNLTVSPATGRKLLEVVVTDQQGNKVALQQVGANIYTFVMPATPVRVATAFTCDRGPTCSTYVFSDLDTTAWYHDAVEYVLEAKLMNGNGDGTFTPTENLSRAMLVQILYNRAGKPAVKAKKLYTDVGPGDWYYDAVTWATENGVVEGNGDGTFEPEVDITREQLATMLWRYSGRPIVAQGDWSFPDLDQADDWAMDALHWAFDQRIMQGDEGGIRPLDTAIRAEAATMLMNAWKNR